MAKKFTLVSEEEAEFLEWVATADTVVLECRIGQHVFPGISDDKTTVAPRRRGGYDLTAFCARLVEDRNCGTELRKVLTSDGILQHAVAKYDHDHFYMLPAGVAEAGNNQLSKRQRGIIRKELMRRKEALDARRKPQRGGLYLGL